MFRSPVALRLTLLFLVMSMACLAPLAIAQTNDGDMAAFDDAFGTEGQGPRDISGLAAGLDESSSPGSSAGVATIDGATADAGMTVLDGADADIATVDGRELSDDELRRLVEARAARLAPKPLSTPPFLVVSEGRAQPTTGGPAMLVQAQYVDGVLQYKSLVELDGEAPFDVRLTVRRRNSVYWLYDGVDTLFHFEPRWSAVSHRVEGVDLLLGARDPWLFFFNRQPTPQSHLYGATLHVLDMRTCDIRPVVHIREEPISWPASWMNAAISPDGRHLALPRHTRIDVEDLHHRIVYSFSWRPPAGMSENPGRYRPVMFTRPHGLAVVSGALAPGDKPTLEVHDIWRKDRRHHIELPHADDGEGLMLYEEPGDRRRFNCLVGKRRYIADMKLTSLYEVPTERLVSLQEGSYRVFQPQTEEENAYGLEIADRLSLAGYSLLAMANQSTVLLEHVTGRAVTLHASGIRSYPVCWLPDVMRTNMAALRHRRR